MDLKSTQLKDTYGNLLTIGTSAGSPQTGTLQNGDGEDITALDIAGTITSDGLTSDGNISLSGNGTGNRWVYLNETNTYEGTLRLQAGGGSAAFGGAITMYGHSHASKPGDVAVGISSGSGGSFRVNLHGIDTGLDALEVKSTRDIAFFDGSGNEAFYWDASAGSLGIGTTSPVAPLDVDANTSAVNLNLRSRTSSDFSNLNFSTDDGATTLVSIGSISDSFRISTGGLTSLTERMRIDSSGNVGIGVSPSGAKLDVLGNLRVRRDVASTQYTEILSGGGESRIIAKNNAAASFQALIFESGNNATTTERMRIDSSGRQLLSSALSYNFIGSNTSDGSDNERLFLSGGGDASSGRGAVIGLYGNEYSGSTGLLSIQAGTASGYINFMTGATTTERMRIDSSGNVTITTGNLILDSGAGIDFSDTPNSSGTMTSELLDDYEEGTWTPEYAPTTGSFATMTYSGSTTGTYTKIGNVVYFVCFINTSNVDATGASGVIKLTGLPFTSSSTTGSGARVGLARRFAGEYPNAWQINASSTEMTFWYYTGLNSDPGLFDTSDLTTGATADRNQLYVTGFYFT